MNANSMNNPFAMNGNSLGMAGGFGAGAGLNMPGGTGLASQAAQMSFASAQQNGHNGMGEGGSKGGGRTRIKEVWRHNLQEEIANLRDLVEKYTYIAMVGRL
jgi:CCR4-NOT transcription complex subunit 7/8